METCSALLALFVDNSTVTGEFPAQRPVSRALMFSLICACIKDWVDNREAGDLRHHCARYDVTEIVRDGDGGYSQNAGLLVALVIIFISKIVDCTLCIIHTPSGFVSIMHSIITSYIWPNIIHIIIRQHLITIVYAAQKNSIVLLLYAILTVADDHFITCIQYVYSGM